MNQIRRKKLQEASALIGRAEALVEYVCDQENDAMENVPEGLQESERFSKMEEAADHLSDALEKLADAREHIYEAAR